ncbi:MAG TPA: hypothetical protein VGR02_21260 [Thermoanaerobaculia bacterium]|jgi:hypothetical protein|nr:hypothetical protein [Thermoanaerobaculia bacterium]
MIRAAAVLFALLTALTASAQRPLFDPDDFLDPRERGGRPVLISRLVVGAGSNLSGDGFRPLGENIGYVHLANSFSWRSVQFDYKRTQMKAEDGEAARWEYRNKPRQGNLLPLSRTRDATSKSKDTLHAAWYWPVPAGGGIPVMLRSRVTFATQPIETEVFVATLGTRHASGRERTFAIDTDTWFRIAGHDFFGSLAVSGTKTRTNANTNGIFVDTGDRDERALTYTNRFPALALNRARILVRPTLTVGGISNRGGSAVNLVNPAIEIFHPFARSGANLHIIYSPQWAADGERWKTTHQVAVLVDRALFVKVF